jgi:hypothetical protein
MIKLTKEEVLKQTSETLKQSELNLDYITQVLVDSDGDHTEGSDTSTSNDEESVLLTLYGNNARTSIRIINGVNWNVYYYEYGDATSSAPTSNRNLACGIGKTFWLKLQDWHHTYDGKCPSGRERWRFDRN